MKAALALGALLCLVPAAMSASFATSALDVRWTSLEGAPSVLEYVSGGSGDTFELQAGSVRLESDATRMAVLGDVGHETKPTATETSHHGPSSWVGRSRAADADLFLVPVEATVAAGNGAGTVALPALECLRQPTYFTGPRATACPDTRSSLHLQGVASDWLILGDFTLILWAWEGTITSPAGTSEFWTGSRPTDANFAGIGEMELRQAFLHVSGGSLRLRLGVDQPVDAYATVLELAADEVAGLDRGTGDVVGTFSEGTLLLQRGALAASRSTMPDEARGSRGWPVGALGATAVLLPIGLLHARRQGAVVHLGLANKNMGLENPLAAARHAAKAARVRHQKVEANVLGAIASIEGRDFDGAQRFLRDLHAQRLHDEAACRYLLAHLRVQQGRGEEGQRLVEECLDLDPSYSIEVASNPGLAPFLDPSKWPRTVE